mgnify:CR=1 FL=1
MHITLKNKKLYYDNYSVKCAIGKRGITKKKKEGDKCTPRGRFRFISLLYRKDRIKLLKTKLKKNSINKNMGWCDDSRSEKYNQLIKFPFKYSAEKLYKKNNSYDVIVVINYNTKLRMKRKGSAIFLHIASRKYKPTLGCVAISKKDMKKLLIKINKSSILEIL